MLTETLVHLLRDNYTEGKIRGKKSFLLGRQQLYSLAEFRTQSEIVGFLGDSPYGPELTKLQEDSSPVETEKAVWKGFARSVKDLTSTAKGNIHEFLLEYVRRFDSYDLATLLIYKSQQKTWEEYVSTRQPLGFLRESLLRRLYSTEDLRELVGRIGDETLEARMDEVSLEDFTPEKASLVRDIFTGWGEEKFYNYIDKTLHGRDRASCLPIVGPSVDLLNVSIILRSKLMGIPNVQGHLVPVRWKIDKRTLLEIASSEDILQALDRTAAVSRYRKLMATVRQQYEESKSLSFLELAVRNQLLDIGRRVFLGFPYTVGVVLAFLVLKENEARSVAAVVSGVSAGLKPEQIRPLITV